jgi:putative transposase
VRRQVLSSCWSADDLVVRLPGAAPPSRVGGALLAVDGCQRGRDPGPPPPAGNPAPPPPRPQAPAQRPRAPCGAQPPPPQAAMVDLHGHARDAAWMAPAHGAPALELPSAGARPAIGSPAGADLDRAAGHREPTLGDQRIRGELLRLGCQVSASSIARVLRADGLQPAPRPASTTWRSCLRRQAAGIVARDFLTVDTVFLQRPYVLFFIQLHARRVHPAGVTANPPAPGSPSKPGTSLARLMRRPASDLIRDRDRKVTRAFDDIWRAVDAEVIRTPIQAPNANAFAERWVTTVRRECLDHLLITGRRHLLRVLHSYVRHYDRHRPHRSLDLSAPEWSEHQAIAGPPAAKQIHCRDVLGGLIHEHERAARPETSFWHPTGRPQRPVARCETAGADRSEAVH